MWEMLPVPHCKPQTRSNSYRRHGSLPIFPRLPKSNVLFLGPLAERLKKRAPTFLGFVYFTRGLPSQPTKNKWGRGRAPISVDSPKPGLVVTQSTSPKKKTEPGDQLRFLPFDPPLSFRREFEPPEAEPRPAAGSAAPHRPCSPAGWRPPSARAAWKAMGKIITCVGMSSFPGFVS